LTIDCILIYCGEKFKKREKTNEKNLQSCLAAVLILIGSPLYAGWVDKLKQVGDIVKDVEKTVAGSERENNNGQSDNSSDNNDGIVLPTTHNEPEVEANTSTNKPIGNLKTKTIVDKSGFFKPITFQYVHDIPLFISQNLPKTGY